MLSIVQSCQELQNERINNSIKEHHNPQVPKEPKKSNIFTIFKGIVPGKYKQAQNLFNISLIISLRESSLHCQKFHVIFSGTKWCGIDDIADSYFDLGKEVEVDKCCRAHDHCPMKIKALGSSYGIKNNHPYTK